MDTEIKQLLMLIVQQQNLLLQMVASLAEFEFEDEPDTVDGAECFSAQLISFDKKAVL